MAEPRVEIPQVDAVPYFTLRFPQGGTGSRIHTWDTSCQDWWEKRYGSIIDYNSSNRYGWLRDVKKARNVLHSSEFIPQSIMMAAVNSPVLEISSLAAQTRKLNVDNFAYALSHPRVSVVRLFDAEGVDQEELQRYKDTQKRLGMTDNEIDWAIITAENIASNRSALVL
jgi:hypothetical protein